MPFATIVSTEKTVGQTIRVTELCATGSVKGNAIGSMLTAMFLRESDVKNWDSDLYEDEQGRYVLRIMVDGDVKEIVLAAEDYLEACAHADVAIRELRNNRLCLSD